MHLVDVVITYLYKSLDTDIRTKILNGFKMMKNSQSMHCNLFDKAKRSLYRLKQSKHIWYNHLSKYLIKEEYINDLSCSIISR